MYSHGLGSGNTSRELYPAMPNCKHKIPNDFDPGLMMAQAREPFKSLRLQLLKYKDTPPDFLDDMESILYVIMWFVVPKQLCTLKCMICWYSSTTAVSTISCILNNSITFNGDKALERLLLKLAEVFASRYTPTKFGGYEVYEDYKGWHEDSSSRVHATKKIQCLKLLESRAGIIKIFDEHLSNEAE